MLHVGIVVCFFQSHGNILLPLVVDVVVVSVSVAAVAFSEISALQQRARLFGRFLLAKSFYCVFLVLLSAVVVVAAAVRQPRDNQMCHKCQVR